MTDAGKQGNTSHTPGPWSVPHFAEPDVNCACGYVLTDSGMGAVCTVHCSGEGDDWAKHGDNPKFAQACANARLIAAAPELLEALSAIYTLAMESVEQNGLIQIVGNCDAMRDARAVLSKAHTP